MKPLTAGLVSLGALAGSLGVIHSIMRYNDRQNEKYNMYVNNFLWEVDEQLERAEKLKQTGTK